MFSFYSLQTRGTNSLSHLHRFGGRLYVHHVTCPGLPDHRPRGHRLLHHVHSHTPVAPNLRVSTPLRWRWRPLAHHSRNSRLVADFGPAFVGNGVAPETVLHIWFDHHADDHTDVFVRRVDHEEIPEVLRGRGLVADQQVGWIDQQGNDPRAREIQALARRLPQSQLRPDMSLGRRRLFDKPTGICRPDHQRFGDKAIRLEPITENWKESG